jgi:ferredoxin/flavodoxin---NADP+ reductase
MIDGTGMCGGCRVLIDGKSKFACVDGPEFEAHEVNFEVLVQRNAMYREAEKRSMEEFRLAESMANSMTVPIEAAGLAKGASK